MNMASAFVSLFHKKVGCPSSQSLLEYDQSRLTFQRSLLVEAHLAFCDFCNAELQLLTRYQDTQDEYSFAEMPAQLRSLAERLLHSSIVPFHALQRLEENRRT
jgi:hypothetical protein